MAGQYFSLNEAILSLRSTMDFDGKVHVQECASDIANLFAHFTHVQVGALYEVDKRNAIVSEPIAKIGLPQSLSKDDSMIKAMFEKQQVIALADSNVLTDSVYTACIPFYDVNKDCHCVLLVDGLKFFSLNEQLLTLMNVLAGNVADLLHRVAEVPAFDQSSQSRFYEQLHRAADTAEKYDVESQVLLIEADEESATAQTLFEFIVSSRRYMDACFQITPTKLYILLSDSSESEAVGFMDRIDRWSNGKYSKNLEAFGINIIRWWCLPESNSDLLEFIALDVEN